METKYFTTKEEDIFEAGCILSFGGLIAFPTETVYGLGANALNEQAVAKIYEVKGRPSDNPMIVHVNSFESIKAVADMENDKLEEIVKTLYDEFCPGPLTFVLPKKDIVPKKTTGGLDTIAVRIPENEVALDLINNADIPIAAPSANISGRPSPTKWNHVAEDLDGKIEGIIKGADSNVGIESTVVEVTTKTLTVLRPGKITLEELSKALEKYDVNVELDVEGGETKPKSPGMKYKHYAPKGEVIIVKEDKENPIKKIEALKSDYEKKGKKVGVLNFENMDLEEIAASLFSKLREMDDLGKEIILVEEVDEKGIGFAIMNRLKKAAGENHKS